MTKEICTHYLKQVCPLNLLIFRIYEEAKGLGTMIKAEIFESSGRDKFIKIYGN